MQVVIDISEELYKASQMFDARYEYTAQIPFTVIKNGIPLPKGHGRLIDADELTESTLCKTFGLRSVDIENAPTIIEADRSNEE